MSAGARRAGGINRFLTGDMAPWADALTFWPVLSFTAVPPPATGPTEALPFAASTEVDFCLSTPTCVVDSESTTTWVLGVRTVEAMSLVATSTEPTCIVTALLFRLVPGFTCA